MQIKIPESLMSNSGILLCRFLNLLLKVEFTSFQTQVIPHQKSGLILQESDR